MFLGVPEFMPKNAHADALTSAAAQRSLELDFGIIPYCVKLYSITYTGLIVQAAQNFKEKY